MRIRQLAWNAAVITAAATAMLGFSTAIAEATPTMSAIHAMKAVSAMPQGCANGQVCAYDLAPHGGINLFFKAFCANKTWPLDPPNFIFEVANLCSHRAWVHDDAGHAHCVSPHTTSAGEGRFGIAVDIQSTLNPNNCPPGT